MTKYVLFQYKSESDDDTSKSFLQSEVEGGVIMSDRISDAAMFNTALDAGHHLDGSNLAGDFLIGKVELQVAGFGVFGGVNDAVYA